MKNQQSSDVLRTREKADQLYNYRKNYRFHPGSRDVYRFIAAIFPCLLGVGPLYQLIAELKERRTLVPPGRIVDLDGSRVHVSSEGSGTPTVVLEAGLGGMSSAWGWIQPEAAKFSHVFSYDRAGLGWSTEDSVPKTAQRVAGRLRALLQKCGVLPPYVLVGHSMGGLFIRVFADLYPDEVAGMVLIDAVHPEQDRRSQAINIHTRSGFKFLRAVPLLVVLGYIRLSGFFNAWGDGLPPHHAAHASAFLSSYRHLKTTLDESLAWEALCAEALQTGGLGNRPLAVVTACKDVLPGHPELQRELLALSSNSTHFAITGADHLTLVTNRTHALSVVAAIRHVVDMAGRPR